MKLEGVIGIGAISFSALGIATTAEPPAVIPLDPVVLVLMIINAIAASATAAAYVTITIRRDRRERDKDTED